MSLSPSETLSTDLVSDLSIQPHESSEVIPEASTEVPTNVSTDILTDVVNDVSNDGPTNVLPDVIHDVIPASGAGFNVNSNDTSVAPTVSSQSSWRLSVPAFLNPFSSPGTPSPRQKPESPHLRDLKAFLGSRGFIVQSILKNTEFRRVAAGARIGETGNSNVSVFIKQGNENDHSLLNELQILSSCHRCLGIVKMVEFHEHPPIVVLENFGTNLTTFMKPAAVEKKAIVEQLLTAVKSFHDCGFVHLNLRPESILVYSAPGEGVQVKLCDFEVSQRIGDDLLTDRSKYSRSWVSPEIYFESCSKAEIGMDMFSIGLVIATLFDANVSPKKTILPASTASEDSFKLTYEKYCSDQLLWNDIIVCKSFPRYSHLVQRMCHLDSKKRVTLTDAIFEYNNLSDLGLDVTVDQLKEEIKSLKANENFQKAVLQGIKELKDQGNEMAKEMKELTTGWATMRNILEQIATKDSKCPTLFIMLPVAAESDTFSFVRDTYRLFFVCAHTMQIAPCGPDKKSGYVIRSAKKWVVKASPFIKIGLCLLKETAASFHVPIPIKPLLNLLNCDNHRFREYIDKAVADIQGNMVNRAFNAAEDILDPNTFAMRNNLSDENVGDALVALEGILRHNDYWDSIERTCGLVKVPIAGKAHWVLKGKVDEFKKSKKSQSSIRSESSTSPAFTPTLTVINAPPSRSFNHRLKLNCISEQTSCSPDGKWIAIVSQNNSIRIFDSDMRTDVTIRTNALYDVNLCFNKFGLFSCHTDKTVKIWYVESGVFTGTGSAFQSIQFPGDLSAIDCNKDGTQFVVAVNNFQAGVYQCDLVPGNFYMFTPLHPIKVANAKVKIETLRYCNSVDRIVFNQGTVLHVHNTISHVELHVIDLGTGRIGDVFMIGQSYVARFTNGQFVAVDPTRDSNAGKLLQVTNQSQQGDNSEETKEDEREVDQQFVPIEDRAMILNNSPVSVSSSRSSSISLNEVDLFSHSALCVAVSADGKVIATGSDKVYLWDANTFKLKGHVNGSGGMGKVVSIAVSADCKTIVTGHDGQTMGIWTSL